MNKTFRIIAGVLSACMFVIELILVIYYMAQGALFLAILPSMIAIIGYALLSIGCFADNKILRIIGSAVGLVVGIYAMVSTVSSFVQYMQFSGINDTFYTAIMAFNIAQAFMTIVYWVLILIMTIIKASNGCLVMGIIAASTQLLLVIYMLILKGTMYISYNWTSWLAHIICIFLAVALGIYLKLNSDKNMAQEIVKEILVNEEPEALGTKARVIVNAQSDETVAKKILSNEEMIKELKKLKELLDAGVISQEELEKLKKEIL